VITRLGLPSGYTSRKTLKDNIDRLGLSTDHFERVRTKYSDEDIAEAVAQAKTVADVCIVLGIKPSGGNTSHIARRIKAIPDIDLRHFTNRQWGVGNRAPDYGSGRLPMDPVRVLTRRPRSAQRVLAKTLCKAMQAAGVRELCATCGCGPIWLGEFLRLEVDHIDGDWSNNDLVNLRFLCPNCHTQTETFSNYRRKKVS
jgi:hypothetical protein